MPKGDTATYRIDVGNKSYEVTVPSTYGSKDLQNLASQIQANPKQYDSSPAQPSKSQWLQDTIKARASELGVPEKVGTTPLGKQGLVNDTGGKNVGDYLAQKAVDKQQAVQGQDVMKYLHRTRMKIRLLF